MAHFVSNFVAMATREGQDKISLAAFNGPTPKPPYRCKDQANFVATATRESPG